MATENNSMENNTTEKKSSKKLVILFTILGVILTFGIIYFIIGANYESTDNAQLDADIISIKSSVPGYIKLSVLLIIRK